ncbi:hypothetical protein B0T21DRAFT_411192 [Apiosordaria backusii]|uniref:Uncharacterized protein n=1 Tax=Apiosordaria backusii TaxID=314023 RepID=A0AA40BKL9_9PEZI|nr:hypothetical protein B0T21DRAFT_411192 [Apiosordaria backusii]
MESNVAPGSDTASEITLGQLIVKMEALVERFRHIPANLTKREFVADMAALANQIQGWVTMNRTASTKLGFFEKLEEGMGEIIWVTPYSGTTDTGENLNKAASSSGAGQIGTATEMEVQLVNPEQVGAGPSAAYQDKPRSEYYDEHHDCTGQDCRNGCI